jgi:hypothetical protein
LVNLLLLDFGAGKARAARRVDRQAAFGPTGPQRPFNNDYPAENARVTFK